MKPDVRKLMMLSALALTLGSSASQGNLPNLAALVRSEGTT
jgi:hypothetical protein